MRNGETIQRTHEMHINALRWDRGMHHNRKSGDGAEQSGNHKSCDAMGSMALIQ